jgi:hypothetical protein
VTVGPILLGAAKPVHILSPSATVRRIVNMTALEAAAVTSYHWRRCFLRWLFLRRCFRAG